MANKSWFAVDKEGLGRVLRRRGLEFMAYELVANAWDSKATKVSIKLEALCNRPEALLTVEDDDPEGFRDITHAFTMFADSCRRGDPTLRGRFNIGEKLVLALANEATIATTTAGLRFNKSGRHTLRQRTRKGSVIQVWFRATRAEVNDIRDKLLHLIPPIPTTLDGVLIEAAEHISSFSAKLETVVADTNDGTLRHLQRKTTVNVHPSVDGIGWLYELGVPVVETGDTYSYDVQQKVPVNLERDNVPPAFLRTLRVCAFNALHCIVPEEACNDPWVRDALTDPRITDEAVREAVRKRFGPKVVAYDPSDPESNGRAFSEGYIVVHGRQLSSSEWANVRRARAMSPAGKVTPSPKPFSPNGRPLKVIPREQWTVGMAVVAGYAQRLYKALLGHPVGVEIANDFTWPYGGAYGPGGPLYLNKARLGNDWFQQGVNDDVVEFLLHEAGHEYCGDHLSAAYHNTLCKLGAKMRDLKHLETYEEARGK